MEKTKNKMLPIILIIIVVILIIVLAVYFLVIKGKSGEKKEHYNFSEYDKKCEMQMDLPDASYSLNMITYMKVEDDRIVTMQNVSQYKFTSREAYNDMLNTNVSKILEKDEDELMLLYAIGDEIDATKDFEGDDQTLLYSEFKDEQERLEGICD